MGELFATDELSLYTMSLIAGAVIVCLALLYWFLRWRGHMAFMRGGANRQPRLAVLDAAAVDARRRLVLVRRDDIEHLILIGGPSDLVVESGIDRAATVTQPEKAKVPVAPRQPARVAKSAPQPQQAARQPVKTDVEQPSETAAPPPRAETKPEPVAPPLRVDAKPEPAAPSPRTETRPEPTAPARRVEAKSEPTRPTRPEAFDRKQPEEPVAPRAATATAVASAATISNGHDRPGAEPTGANPAPAPGSEDSTSSARQAAVEKPVPVAAQSAPPAVSEPDSAEKQVETSSTSDSEVIKAEFEAALDAARELVLPATTPASEAPPAPEPDVNYAHAVSQQPKPETPSVAATPPAAAKSPAEPTRQAAASQQNVTAEDLIADFDRVLEAEMNKSEGDQLPQTVAKQPETEDGAENGASLEDEMKKLLGELTAKQ